MGLTATEARLQGRVDRREVVRQKHEALLAEREDSGLNETDKKTIDLYRVEAAELDSEIEGLIADAEANKKAEEVSRQLRRASLDEAGFEDGDGVIYRTMAAFARDVILSRESTVCSQIAQQFGDKQAVEAANTRLQLLKRNPANTLSSDTTGLQPEQHIAQIFQVIDASRPLVASANRVGLVRGSLTYPEVTQRPLVAVQASEKTEAGNQKMIVVMRTATASTYLGGGDLSWQAINWSTPDALQLWFDLAAENYAIQTEEDAGEVVQTAASNNLITDQLTGDGSDEFADWILAITEGASEVYANSRRLANTIYLAPDMFYFAAAVTSAAGAQLIAPGQLNLGSQTGTLAGMNVVVSPGLDAGVAAVGYSQALLVAETPGAPVELRVVEPAIGGVEVGIIGAFEAVSVDDDQFALIGTAS